MEPLGPKERQRILSQHPRDQRTQFEEYLDEYESLLSLCYSFNPDTTDPEVASQRRQRLRELHRILSL